MKKLVSVLTLVFMVSTVAASTGYDGAQEKTNVMDAPTDQAPTDIQPTIPNKPSTGPSKGLSGILPKQASPVAKQVLNTVDELLASPGKTLGNALQGLLGNGKASNLSEK